MADTRDSDSTHVSRADRGDAALVAQYLHDLSERHGGGGEPDVRDPDGDGSDEGG
jgi:hypothetical protein